MRVISLWQPWASLVVMGAKKMETRHWTTKYRGPLLIHAAQKKVRVNERTYRLIEELEKLPDFMENYEKLPYGAIIGRVDLIDCIPVEKLSSGHYVGNFDNPNLFDTKPPKMIYQAFLTDKERAFGDYSAGRFAWILRNPVQFEKSIPVKGRQGFFNYTGEIPAL